MIKKVVKLFISLLISNCMLLPGYSSSKELQADAIKGKIVFRKKDDKRSSQIFVIDEADHLKKITNEGDNLGPRWSQDGKRIVFTSSRKGHPLEIYTMDADGTNQKRLTYTTGGFSRFPRWGSDGMRIYFFSNIKGNLGESVVDLRTGEVKTLNETKVQEIKAVPLEELKKKKDEELKEIAKGTENTGREILKNVSGSFRVYPSPDDNYQVIHYPYPSPGRVSIVDMKTKAIKDLELKGDDPAWSKDGKRLAYFIEPHPAGTLAIYDLEKGTYEKLEVPKKINEECGTPSWSGDSNKIVYVCGPVAGPGNSWLYILDLETKKSEKLIQGSSPDWY